MNYASVPISLYTRIPNPGEIKGVSGEKWVATKWFVVIDVKKADAYKKIRKILMQAMFVLVGLVVVGVGIAVYFSMTLSSPITKLTNAAKSIAEGNLSETMPEIKSADEIGYLATNFDNMRKKLKESYGRLEDDVKEKTKELTAKNKELEQIVYVTSHDLRSPLVNIQGFSKELTSALEDVALLCENEDIPEHIKEKLAPLLQEDVPESLQFIQKSIVKMDGLLTGLLRLSRLGRAVLQIEECDMNELIKEVVATSDYQINDVGAVVDIGSLPPCRGDSSQLNQVFSNLLDNALKYFDPNRPGRIKISGKVTTGHVVYCVEDNGIGIAEEHKEKSFEIFHRLNPTAVPGEGLGLTIVSRIVEKHDGKIWLESKPGEGSRFYVEFPLTG